MGAPNGHRFEAQPSTALRDAEIVRLRAQGQTFSQIGAHFGLNKTTVKRRWDQALEESRKVRNDAAEEYRAQERAVLEAMRSQLVAIVYADHLVVSSSGKVTDQADHGPVIAAIRELRQVSESLRKLDGLDAPSKSEVRVTDDITAEIAELAAELGAADRSITDRSEEGAPGPAQSPA